MALFAVLLLTLVSFVFVPTRRVVVHRPPVAQGRIDRITPAGDAAGVHPIPSHGALSLSGAILDARRVPGRAVTARVDGRRFSVRDAALSGARFALTISGDGLSAGEHHLSVWVVSRSGDEQPLLADVVFRTGAAAP